MHRPERDLWPLHPIRGQGWVVAANPQVGIRYGGLLP